MSAHLVKGTQHHGYLDLHHSRMMYATQLLRCFFLRQPCHDFARESKLIPSLKHELKNLLIRWLTPEHDARNREPAFLYSLHRTGPELPMI